jgi:glycosyltransferase involved in cell wall biosynthesis
MSCLRILHVVFSSRIAGSERYCVDLANRQAAAGHEVHVAGMDSSPLRQALSPEVIFHGFNWFLRGFLLHRLVDRLSPDICHGHLSAACKALGRTAGRHATVATLHVGFKAHQHGRLDGLICVNRAQSSRLSGYAGLARVIPNWLPLANASDAPSLRSELGLDVDTFLVGAVGRLHPSKGMDVLIEAFQSSAPARAALVILGEGPQRPELEQLRKGDPRIHFLGYRPDVQPCLRDFDLFVSPSREESFGLAIIEAMRAGLPIISTAAEGPAEILCDQPVSLVPPGSKHEMAGAIAASYGRFCTDGLPKIEYDLSLFDPAARLANITDFYGHVIDARQLSRAKVADAVAAAT